MKKLLLIPFLLLSIYAISQDTLVNMGTYVSKFDRNLKAPLYVKYKLFHGGGECDRSKFTFKTIPGIPSATDKDYSKSGFDKGHLADAEDFAFDCVKDELTFRYINCVPQNPTMNRGVWKELETKVRKESQTDSLLIIAGGIYPLQCCFIGKGVAVPKQCWKVVQSLSSKEILHCTLFDNTSESMLIPIKLEDLEKLIGYLLPIKK